VKIGYCYACKREVAMVEPDEWAPIGRLFRRCRQDVADHMERHGVRFEQVPLDALFEPVTQAWMELTGEAVDPQHIPAHRLPTLGGTCPSCRAAVRPGEVHCGLCGASL
jgi:hypothetical protein